MVTKRIKEDKLILKMKPENASKTYIVAVFKNSRLYDFYESNLNRLCIKEKLLFLYDAIEETLSELEAQEYEKSKRFI